MVCHGGDPKATDKEQAHKGSPGALVKVGGPQDFYPDPGSIWVSQNTCGQCHANYTESVKKSLMNTEAGKLQGNFWTWGLQSDMKADLGNYSIKDEDGPVPVLGSKVYKDYMKSCAENFRCSFFQ